MELVNVDISFTVGYFGFINSYDAEKLLIKNYSKPEISTKLEGFLSFMEANNAYVNLEHLVEFFTKLELAVDSSCYRLYEELVSVKYKEIKKENNKLTMVVEAEYR